jgi:two-component system cell cycle response regulator
MTERARALVVEQDVVVQELLRRRLQEFGSDIELASNAPEALLRAARRPFDLVVISVTLADTNLATLLAELRALPGLADAGLLITTPRHGLAAVSGLLERGADDFVLRPIDSIELRARVRTLLRARRATEELQRRAARIDDLQVRLNRTSLRDGLTGLDNRLTAEARLAEELERARRYRHPVAVVLFDVDHFRALNATHGMAAGDAVLREVARRLRDAARRVDTVARHGADEFIVLAPATTEVGARALAARASAAVASEPIRVPGSDGDRSVQVSTTVAVVAHEPEEASAEATVADVLSSVEVALDRIRRARSRA